MNYALALGTTPLCSRPSLPIVTRLVVPASRASSPPIEEFALSNCPHDESQRHRKTDSWLYRSAGLVTLRGSFFILVQQIRPIGCLTQCQPSLRTLRHEIDLHAWVRRVYRTLDHLI